MELRHYADKQVVLDRSRTYTQTEPDFYKKPNGFWVSVAGEDDWVDWCLNNEFAAESLTWTHNVTLAPNANLLHIDSAEGLDTFTDNYGTEPERGYKYLDTRSIDWRKVATDYDGLIIVPYQWSQRMCLHWYYGWDCASGCIWSLDAISSVTPRTAAPTQTPTNPYPP